MPCHGDFGPWNEGDGGNQGMARNPVRYGL
jgi:hypothetical protein